MSGNGAGKPDNPLTFAQVLLAEQVAIDGFEAELNASLCDREGTPIVPNIFKTIQAKQRTALCLSGGGIRSAAFSFGVIQRLAEEPITSRDNKKAMALSEFDYLSTVSGGGYTGSWLTAWIYRSDKSITHSLTARTDGFEAPEIRHLRANSRYLARHGGFFSADLWADIACCVRNLSLVWLLIVPLAASVVLGLMIVAVDSVVLIRGWAPSVWLPLAIVTAAVSLGYEAASIPTRHVSRVKLPVFYLLSGLCWFVACWSLTICIAQSCTADSCKFALGPWHLTALCVAALFAAIYPLTWLVTTPILFRAKSNNWATPNRAGARPAGARRAGDAPYQYRGWMGWIAGGIAFGMIVWGGILLAVHLGLSDGTVESRLALLVLAPPFFIAARLIGDTIYAAISERVTDSDVNLEWLSRAGGYFLRWLLFWSVGVALIMFGPAMVAWMGQWKFPGLSAATLLSGLGAALIGKSPGTGPITMLQDIQKRLTLQQIAALLAGLFAIGAVIVTSAAIDRLLFHGIFAEFYEPIPHDLAISGLELVALVIFVGGASWFVNINRFSLHGLYRNRLMRTFLGASKSKSDREKTRDPFTDYDGNDTPLLADLLLRRGAQQGGRDWIPFQVINTTLNAASSDDLTLQERKALPFTFSPLHAGSAALFAHDKAGAFRSVRDNGVNGKGPYGGSVGLTLATAMAISGAAVNPNMGYSTSPGLSFLMALFNIRLGWWLASPASEHVDYTRTGPSTALHPLLSEMFGLTNDKSRWLLLTDGGHFDNTGLYEMIRRRCPLIVMVDGGCDPAYEFSDLGRTLEKIQVDFGIPIRFKGIDKLKVRFTARPTPAVSGPYWAVGKIAYSESDPSLEDGLVLYIKAGLHGTEPLDILNYGITHPEFPHDTTVDQFYGEAQFEAYRALGFEIVDQMLRGPRKRRTSLASPTLQDVIVDLWRTAEQD